MSFSISPWFFLPVLAAGIWLAYRLYFDLRNPMSRRWRGIFIALTLFIWILLAGLIVQPLWTASGAIYHPPAVVLAVDESPSYAAGATLHARDEVQKSVDEIRKSYQGKGFQVLEFGFGETVHPAHTKANVGVQTSLVALHRHLDSLAIPNLQGVFLWTDGRSNRDTNVNLGAWPAPVFPVSVRGRGSEIQGENVQADLSDRDSGAEISVEWRAVGLKSSEASMEIRSGTRILWKGLLPVPDSNSGEKLRHHFRLPARAFQGAGEEWAAWIRPENKGENTTVQNDTVGVHLTGAHHKRQIFVRPLQSLEERGLVDALFASDSLEAVAVSPESLALSIHGGDVLWARSQDAGRAVAAAKKSGAPVILYTMPGVATGKVSSFTSAARVTWRSDADRFLPGGVLSLSDLGFSTANLPAEESSMEAIAWVEENGHRGLLVGRRKNAEHPVVEFTAPPLWSTEFHTGSDERIRHLQQLWIQGVAGWMSFLDHHNGASKSDSVFRDPMDVEMARLGVDREQLSGLAMATRGSVLQGQNGLESLSTRIPDLPAGQMREVPSQSRPVFPLLFCVLIAVIFLCAIWVFRKRLHLD